MKRLILLLTILLIATVAYPAEFETTFQVGGLAAYGGSTHTAYFSGGEIPLLKEDTTGVSVSTRIGFFTVRNVWPEQEGEYMFTCIKQVLKYSPKGWNPYVMGKSGFINTNINGDDEMSLAIGLEAGISLFTRKVEIGIGADMLPVDGTGDQTFGYFILNFNLR